MQKKSDDTGEISNLNSDVIVDTIPHAIDLVQSWMHIFEILEHEFRNCPDDFGNERTKNKLKDIVESELHKLATQPRLMPYNDMIDWALEKTDIQTRNILNSQEVVVDLFRPKHIQVMYKLPPTCKYIYNVEFVEEFERKECIEFDQTYLGIIK